VRAASANEINMISQVFLVFYLPASILAMVLMERRGLRTTLLVGMGLDAACALVKFGGSLLTNHRRAAYGLVLFGQILGSLGQPLILNLSARVSMDWFPDRERDTATVILTMANVMGQMCGSLLPPYLVNGDREMQMMLLATAVPSVAVLCVSFFALADRPPSPPSAAAAEQWAAQDASRLRVTAGPARPKHGGANVGIVVSPAQIVLGALRSVWADTRALLRSCNFALLLAGFSIAIGAAWAILTVQAQIIQPCGFDDTVAGNSGAALLGVGVIFSFIVGPIMQRTKAYASIQKVVMALSVGAVAFALAVNKPNNLALIYTAWCLCGATLMPMLPISLEHAAEVTFPVSADTSSSILLIGANLVGMALIFALGPLLQLPVSINCSSVATPAAAVILSFLVVGLLFTLPIRAQLSRQAADASRKSAAASAAAIAHLHATLESPELAPGHGHAVLS
jgi:MFS family permease